MTLMMSMKKLRLIVLLFISTSHFYCASQQELNLDSETVIVFFDKNELNQEKWEESSETKDSKERYFRYLFYFNKVDKIQLTYMRYKDFDEKEKDNPELFLKVNKSFLRKNKETILTHKKMLDLGYERVFNLFKNAKHILLIDEEDKEKNIIVIKRVFHFYLANE